MTVAVVTTPSPRCRELDDVTRARAQQGNAAAFRELVETYQDAVFALIWRLLGRRAAAAEVEDLAQVSFLGVYRALPRWRPNGPAKLSTWILTIAARTALKSRRGGGRETIAIDEIAETLPAPHATDRAADHRAFGQALASALDRLPDAYRAVFVLHAYHELDHRDIAAALEIEIGTVKSRLSRAREQLREELEGYE